MTEQKDLQMYILLYKNTLMFAIKQTGKTRRQGHRRLEDTQDMRTRGHARQVRHVGTLYT